jgi:uncharacterized damage-inducible protein DinB
MGVRDAFVSEFDHEVATTRRLLERLPEDEARLAWKPHAKSMSLGGIGTHISSIPTWTTAIFDRTTFDLADAPAALEEKRSRAAILSHFDDSIRAARKALDKTDAEFAAMWSLRRDGQEVFSMPRTSVFRNFVLNHLIHHRGQLSVYLRLNDIPVPSIYGPSADEGQ